MALRKYCFKRAKEIEKSAQRLGRAQDGLAKIIDNSFSREKFYDAVSAKLDFASNAGIDVYNPNEDVPGTKPVSGIKKSRAYAAPVAASIDYSCAQDTAEVFSEDPCAQKVFANFKAEVECIEALISFAISDSKLADAGKLYKDLVEIRDYWQGVASNPATVVAEGSFGRGFSVVANTGSTKYLAEARLAMANATIKRVEDVIKQAGGIARLYG